MKTKTKHMRITISLAALLIFSGGNLMAQSWNITGNAGIASGTNYLGTSDPNDLVFRTNALERGRLLGTTGEWRFGGATNYVSIDGTGKLKFAGTGVYQVGGNKYAFQFSGNPNYGLFFNTTNDRYEFRDGSAAPVFYVTASTGAGTFLSSLKVGAYTLPATDGTVNQVLKTNGAGVLTWSNDNGNTYLAGTGLSLVGNTFNNTAPDQTVTLAGTNGISISGAYPNFTASGAGLWKTTGNSGTDASSNFIGTTDNFGFAIRTNNTERIRVQSDGDVGIGTTSALQKLHVAGNTYITGNLGIGNSAPVNKLDVSGNAAFTGIVGVRGATNTSYALTVNASSLYDGIIVTDPVDNYVLNSTKSGASYGIYVSKTSTTSSTATIYGANAGTGSGIYGTCSSTGQGVYGYNNGSGYGVEGYGTSNYGVYAYSADYRALYASGDALYYTAYFNGDTYSTGSYLGSDAKLKKNIKDVSNAMDIINKLQPKNYEFRNDGNYELMHLPKGNHYGLIAQDVERILPNLVKETTFDTKDAKPRKPSVDGKEENITAEKNETIDFKAVNYTELIPILVKALQEQDAKIEMLSKELNSIKNGQSIISNTQTANAITNVNVSNASLEQNAPNPFSSSTVIRYNIPSSSKAAQIIISNAAGNTVKTFSLTAKGAGSVTINAGELSAGSYYYTLIVDGKKADSKQMILIK